MIVMQRDVSLLMTPDTGKPKKYHTPRSIGGLSHALCNPGFLLEPGTAADSTALTVQQLCLHCVKILHRRVRP